MFRYEDEAKETRKSLIMDQSKNSNVCSLYKWSWFPIAFSLVSAIGITVTFFIAKENCHLEKWVLPYISYTGTEDPESMIFSLILNTEGFLGLIVVFLAWRYYHHMGVEGWINRFAFVCGALSCIGVVFVGNFQVTKAKIPHYIGAGLIFISGTVYGFFGAILSKRAFRLAQPPLKCATFVFALRFLLATLMLLMLVCRRYFFISSLFILYSAVISMFTSLLVYSIYNSALHTLYQVCLFSFMWEFLEDTITFYRKINLRERVLKIVRLNSPERNINEAHTETFTIYSPTTVLLTTSVKLPKTNLTNRVNGSCKELQPNAFFTQPLTKLLAPLTEWILTGCLLIFLGLYAFEFKAFQKVKVILLRKDCSSGNSFQHYQSNNSNKVFGEPLLFAPVNRSKDERVCSDFATLQGSNNLSTHFIQTGSRFESAENFPLKQTKPSTPVFFSPHGYHLPTPDSGIEEDVIQFEGQR